jgi:hypothetical protein
MFVDKRDFKTQLFKRMKKDAKSNPKHEVKACSFLNVSKRSSPLIFPKKVTDIFTNPPSEKIEKMTRFAIQPV